MIGSKLAIATLKTTLSALLILGVVLWPRPALAQIVTPEDPVQYFKGIVARDDKCPARINSKPANPCSESLTNQTLQRTREISLSVDSEFEYLIDHPRSNWKVEAASQDWLNLNRGDGSRDLIKFVVWQF